MKNRKNIAKQLVEEIVEIGNDIHTMVDGMEDLLFRLVVMAKDLNKELPDGESKAMVAELTNNAEDMKIGVNMLRTKLLNEPIDIEPGEKEDEY